MGLVKPGTERGKLWVLDVGTEMWPAQGAALGLLSFMPYLCVVLSYLSRDHLHETLFLLEDWRIS